MNRLTWISWIVAAAALLPICAACGTGSANDDDATAWQLTLADEFDGPAGTPPDSAIWTHDIGGHGWGNDQLEYNTNRTANVALDGQGRLRISALRESFGGNDYTSGRIKTKGLFEQKYGRFEARIKLPEGQGIWPAFWMLGANIDEVSWPQCGEIDILELRGGEPDLLYGTIHGPGYSGGDAIGATYRLPAGQSFGDDFHVFAVEWDPGQMRFSLDATVYQTISTAAVTARGRWAFDQPFFLILNVAVGGNFVGPVGANTEFPASMLVDYVRVFERPR